MPKVFTKSRNFLLKKDKKIFSYFLYFCVFIFFLEKSTKIVDTDVYYFIPNGEYILKNGIPYINPFIGTPNVPITIQNWLYCVIIALANGVGVWGMITLQVFLLFLTFYLTFYFLKDIKDKNLKLIFVILFAEVFSYWSIRPQQLTYILCMLEIIGIEKYNSVGRIKWLWLVPATILIEINCHASYWIMHYVVLLPYVVPTIWKIKDNSFKGKKLIFLTIFSLIGVGALFINPYGTDAIIYVFRALGDSTFKIVNNIAEQRVWNIISLAAFFLLLGIILFLYSVQAKKIDSVSFWMFLGFTFLGILKVKFICFYAFGFLFLLRTFKNYELNFAPRVFIVLILFNIALSLFFSNINFAIFADEDFLSNPKVETSFKKDIYEIEEYLSENKTKDICVLAQFQYENYFEYKGYKVYYDARPEIYPEELLQEVVTFYGESTGKIEEKVKVQNEINIDYAIVPTSSQTFLDLQANDNYELVLKKEDFSLFKKD